MIMKLGKRKKYTSTTDLLWKLLVLTYECQQQQKINIKGQNICTSIIELLLYF